MTAATGLELRIPGVCPFGCGDTLSATEEHGVVCNAPACPHPTFVNELLNADVDHQVTIGEHHFSIQHPLAERHGDQLHLCSLHTWIRQQPRAPVEPGRYRVVYFEGAWRFRRLADD